MSPAPSASTLLPSGDKLEMELESAPKGLILIVKEPGESNLIVGRASIMRGFPSPFNFPCYRGIHKPRGHEGGLVKLPLYDNVYEGGGSKFPKFLTTWFMECPSWVQSVI